MNERVEIMVVAEDEYTRYVCPNCGATVARDKNDIPDRCHHCGVEFVKEDVPETIDKESLCRELLAYYIKINGLNSRMKELTGNLPTMFLNFSGHVNMIYVSIYPSGWESELTETDLDNPEIIKRFEFGFDGFYENCLYDTVVKFRTYANSLLVKMENDNV